MGFVRRLGVLNGDSLRTRCATDSVSVQIVCVCYLTDLLLSPLCVPVGHLPRNGVLRAALVVVTPCIVWLARHALGGGVPNLNWRSNTRLL